MPLTDFQREVLVILAPTRTPSAYLAGGVLPRPAHTRLAEPS